MLHDNTGGHWVLLVLGDQEVQIVVRHRQTKQDGGQEDAVLPPVPVVARSVSQGVVEAVQ